VGLRVWRDVDVAVVTTYQAHARRREKAAAKAGLREVAPEEFGECELCGFTHSWPLERTVCEVCGGAVCFGEPVCGCGDGGGIRCYAGATINAPATPATTPGSTANLTGG
jgi:hypothetical protein